MPTSPLRERLWSTEGFFTISSLSLCLCGVVRAHLHRREQFLEVQREHLWASVPLWNCSDRGESPHWGSCRECATFPSEAESFVKISLLCCAHFTNPLTLWERGTSDGMELWRERFQGYWRRRVVRDGKQVILIHPPQRLAKSPLKW